MLLGELIECSLYSFSFVTTITPSESVFHEEVVPTRLLLPVLLRVHLVDARSVVVRIATERDGQVLQEAVHSAQQPLW